MTELSQTILEIAKAYDFEVGKRYDGVPFISTEKDSGFYWDASYSEEDFWRELAKHFYDNGYNDGSRY